MERAIELELIEELVELKQTKTPFLDSDIGTADVGHYTDPARFESENKAIFRRMPHAAAHVSELAGPGDYRRIELAGLPVLLTRDKEGAAHAFLNVCRHRGAQLVEEEGGCKHRFTCPYHAWTYSSGGDLIGAPHFDSGFPGMDKGELSLKPLPLREAMGLIWVVPTPGENFDFDAWLGTIGDEFGALDLENATIAAEDTLDIAANWKILIEGGIEAYHFKVAHRATIAPFFEDNLSSYQMFGNHMRSILPRATMAKLSPDERENWRIRDHANILYTFFPLTQFLVQQDHTVMIRSTPLAADRTQLRIATLAPKDGPDAEEKDATHWARNHKITRVTLDEDFDIGEGIQRGLASGANERLTFGRFEGALTTFNQAVDDMIDAAR